MKHIEENQISEQVDSWIMEEELPTRANFKPLRNANPAYMGIADPATGEWILEPMDEDEIEAYREYLSWFMSKDFHLAMSLPKPKDDEWNMPVETDEEETLSFAFGSADFARQHPNTYNSQHYRLKKIYEKVEDLATTHAAISDDRREKQNTFERFKNLVEKEFRDEAMMYLEAYKKHPQWVDKKECFRRIQELNRKIYILQKDMEGTCTMKTGTYPGFQFSSNPPTHFRGIQRITTLCLVCKDPVGTAREKKNQAY